VVAVAASRNDMTERQQRCLARSVEQLPGRLVAALSRARAHELSSAGAEQRSAFRITGQLLGAAMEMGFPVRLLAECVGTSTGSVRSRARHAGWLDPAAAEMATALDVDQLMRLAAEGRLPGTQRDNVGGVYFSAVDIVGLIVDDDGN
jgi:hypothetical protein